MGILSDIYRWSTGGNYQYRTLTQSLNGDWQTAYAIVAICTMVAIGYAIIAFRWFRAARSLPNSDAKSAMNSLMWIFIYSLLSGYLWPLIKMWAPVWRLQLIGLACLCLHTWWFVLHPKWLRGIADHLGERDRLLARNRALNEKFESLMALFDGTQAGANGEGRLAGV